MQKRMAPDAGLTLVEMMVTVAIIGLVTAVVVINVLPAQDRARVEKARADVRMIEQALELYRLDRASYPSMQDGLGALVAVSETQAQPYIRRLPDDPWGRPYQYISPGERGAYDLYSFGADAQQGGEGLDADIGNWD